MPEVSDWRANSFCKDSAAAGEFDNASPTEGRTVNFELDGVPEQPRRPAVYPWGRLWLNTFSAVFAAILLVQVLNLIIGYALFNHLAAKFNEGMKKPAAVEVKK